MRPISSDVADSRPLTPRYCWCGVCYRLHLATGLDYNYSCGGLANLPYTPFGVAARHIGYYCPEYFRLQAFNKFRKGNV